MSQSHNNPKREGDDTARKANAGNGSKDDGTRVNSPTPAQPSTFLVLVDRDPAASKYSVFRVSSPPTVTDPWAPAALAHFSPCGACLDAERPATTIAFSQPWVSTLVSSTAIVAGFASCDREACVQLSQLRADTRRECFLASGRAPFSTPESVTKACAYCAMARENMHTFMCSRCKAVRYCNQACQKAHWRVHKRVCVPVV